MRIAAALLSTGALALVGCRSILGFETAGAPTDGNADASLGDGTDGPAFCYGSTFPICVDGTPAGDLALGGVVNTTDCTGGVALEVGGTVVCLIVAGTITIDSVLGLTGERPLVLLAADHLTIGVAGVIDASSRLGGGDGPGANPLSCTIAGDGAGSASGGCGGGAGGSLGSSGGRGGDGISPGGNPAPAGPTTSLGGGCPGGAGGTPNASPPPGSSGGGAIYVVATVLQVAGTINASGAGGSGGVSPGSGGGGGGSGGLIVLDAASIQINASARVFANGGGGGAGAGVGAGEDGSESTGPSDPAAGAAGSGGGAGGDGGVTAAGQAGQNSLGSVGAGGGGGGTGRIRVVPSTTVFPGGTVSPPPS